MLGVNIAVWAWIVVSRRYGANYFLTALVSVSVRASSDLKAVYACMQSADPIMSECHRVTEEYDHSHTPRSHSCGIYVDE